MSMTHLYDSLLMGELNCFDRIQWRLIMAVVDLSFTKFNGLKIFFFLRGRGTRSTSLKTIYLPRQHQSFRPRHRHFPAIEYIPRIISNSFHKFFYLCDDCNFFHLGSKSYKCDIGMELEQFS